METKETEEHLEELLYKFKQLRIEQDNKCSKPVMEMLKRIHRDIWVATTPETK